MKEGDRVRLSELGRRTFRWATIHLSEFGTVKAVEPRPADKHTTPPTPEGIKVQVQRDGQPPTRNNQGGWYDSSFWEALES